MKANNNNTETRKELVINAIQNGTHEESALCIAAGMREDYADFCMILWELQRAGLVVYVEGCYYLSDEETKAREAANADRIERERATAEAVTKANEKPDTHKQFADLKTKYPDALLLFRCGDHYETYEEDAQTIAAAFGLTISEEDGHKLAAFPAADLSDYLPALIRKGHRVAICDQLEAPRKIERRRITETVCAQATESHQDSDNNDESTNTPAATSEATTEPQSEPSKAAKLAAVVADYAAGMWHGLKTNAAKLGRAALTIARRLVGVSLLAVGVAATFAVFVVVLTLLASVTPYYFALRLLLVLPAFAVAFGFEIAFIKTFGTINHAAHLLESYHCPRW